MKIDPQNVDVLAKYCDGIDSLMSEAHRGNPKAIALIRAFVITCAELVTDDDAIWMARDAIHTLRRHVAIQKAIDATRATAKARIEMERESQRDEMNALKRGDDVSEQAKADDCAMLGRLLRRNLRLDDIAEGEGGDTKAE